MHLEDSWSLVGTSNAGCERSAYAQYVVLQLAIGLICIMYVRQGKSYHYHRHPSKIHAYLGRS